MGKGRPDLFPRDRALQARMVLTLAAAALITVVYGGLLLLFLVGLIVTGGSERLRAPRRARDVQRRPVPRSVRRGLRHPRGRARAGARAAGPDHLAPPRA